MFSSMMESFRLELNSCVPIYENKRELNTMVTNHKCVIVTGDPYTGKTAKIPQFLRDFGYCDFGCKIICTQPTSERAKIAANIVSEQLGCLLGGDIVGYKTINRNCTNAKTAIIYVTEKKLVSLMIDRKLHKHDALENCTAIVLDQAHERTVYMDLLLALFKRMLDAQDGGINKLIIVSSNWYYYDFSRYFSNARTLSISRRPNGTTTKVLYAAGDETGAKMAAKKVDELLFRFFAGDVLVFLANDEEVHEARELLEVRTRICPFAPRYHAVALYSHKLFDMKIHVRESARNLRRNVYITSAASYCLIPIKSVRFVIDSGVTERFVGYSVTKKCFISKCEARNRLMMANDDEGAQYTECHRMYTKQTFKVMDEKHKAQIELTRDLNDTMYAMRALDLNFNGFIDMPPKKHIEEGERDLKEFCDDLNDICRNSKTLSK